MKKIPSRLGIGASSILLIVVSLCLVVFSVLALLAARMDQRLTDKTAQSITAYYEADAEAQRLFSELDGAAQSGYPLQDVLPTGTMAADGTFSYSVAVNDTLSIAVVLKEDGGRLSIKSYRLVNTATWDSVAATELWQ